LVTRRLYSRSFQPVLHQHFCVIFIIDKNVVAPKALRESFDEHVKHNPFFIANNYDPQTINDLRTGPFMPTDIVWIADARRADWGKRYVCRFRQPDPRVANVCPGGCSEGNFRIVIRRDLSTKQLWSFAMDWNSTHRIIGFFGDTAVAKCYIDRFPRLEMKQLDQTTRYREEVPLNPEDDVMFSAGTPPKISRPSVRRRTSFIS
jgi:hypothetical protein